jgi:hypothetical protein
MKKNIVILPFVLLFVIMISFVEGSEGETLKGITMVRVSVTSIPSDLGFTENDIKKYVYVTLRSKLPSLKIDTTPASSIPYVLYIPATLYRTNGAARGHVSVELRRKVFLPDKTTSLLATVWSKGRIFGDSVNKIYPALKEQLDSLLDDFAYDYFKAQEK